MANVFGVIKRPLVTEKGMTAKESSQTLCFEVDARSNKNEIRHAVEKAFKVKVDEVRTSTTAGRRHPRRQNGTRRSRQQDDHRFTPHDSYSSEKNRSRQS